MNLLGSQMPWTRLLAFPILAGLSAFILFLLSGMESLLQPSETWANPSRVLLVYDRLLLSGRLNIGMQIRVLQLQLSAR